MTNYNLKTLVIAEAGVNHNGKLEDALKLVDVAVEAGADIVKFQTFKAKNLVTSEAKMADYQKNNLGSNESQLEMLKKLELSFEDHHTIIDHCKKKGIRFLSTAFDTESFEFLRSLKMGLWKIPSGEITNLPYLVAVAKTQDPVIISTGMSDYSEVETAVNVFLNQGLERSKITVLHCNTEYPTPFKDVNLRAMVNLGRKLELKYGYSDHTMGVEVPIAAVALGATVIEKHFTLSRDLPGPDHKASLEPNELKAMVTAIRNIEVSMGSEEKKPTESELKNRVAARKSIVANAEIKPGDVFNEKNLACARPGSGLSPMRWNDFIGKHSKKAYQKGDLISEE